MDSHLKPFQILTDQVAAILRSAIELAPNLLAALVVLLVTLLLALAVGRVMKTVMRRSRLRPSLTEAIVKLSRLSVWLVGILIAATLLFPNLTPTKMLAGLGLGSIAIGLAFKDIFENFLAGFLILLRKPMRIGDDIDCAGLSGRVEHISIRDTFLRKRSGELVLVPNSYIYKNPVEILTDRPLRRISLVVGVAYGEDVEEARSVISAAMESLETRESARPFDVFTSEFGASSVDFLVRWWTGSTPKEEHASRSEAISRIKSALDEAGLEIPFPYRTLTFKDPLRVTGQPQESDGPAAG